MPAPRRPLPIGIQTFAKLREDGAYYVDKTGLAIDLIESGGCFFLSRPRRFGKSLLLDTLKELFEANRPLFTGLAAETRWDWVQRRARHLPWLHRVGIEFGRAAPNLVGFEVETLRLICCMPGLDPGWPDLPRLTSTADTAPPPRTTPP